MSAEMKIGMYGKTSGKLKMLLEPGEVYPRLPFSKAGYDFKEVYVVPVDECSEMVGIIESDTGKHYIGPRLSEKSAEMAIKKYTNFEYRHKVHKVPVLVFKKPEGAGNG